MYFNGEGNRECENKQIITSDIVMSPFDNRFLPPTSNIHRKLNFEVANDNCNYYSPFIVKKTNTLRNSMSSNEDMKDMSAFTITGDQLTQRSKIYTPSPRNAKKEILSDRFIPMNKKINLLEKFELARNMEVSGNFSSHEGRVENNSSKGNDLHNDSYSDFLENNFFTNDNDEFYSNLVMRQNEIIINSNPKSRSKPIGSKMLSFKTMQKRRTNALITQTTAYDKSPVEDFSRKISTKAYKIIEAPGLIDDFYLNLLDWSSKNDIAVGLGSSLVLWCANKTQEVKLFTYNEDKYVTSLMWSPSGDEIAIGNSDGFVEIWDGILLTIEKFHLVEAKQVKRVFEGHTARVGVVSWNGNIISTGSKDYTILNRDARANTSTVSKYIGHKQEVCGLKWSFDGSQLASGGNDNKLMIWNLHSTKPLMKASHHTAAVKAIAWSPHQHCILASGGGTADRCIRFWSTSNFTQTSYVDTGSQVCNLVFSKTSNELISTHGYSLNQIINWKLPSMTRIATLSGHTYRVLYLAISPDGENIVTGAGDQALRFWNVFPPAKSNYGSSCLFPSHTDVR